MPDIDFLPAYNRYPAALSAHLMRIAAAHAVIEGARILPAQEDILRISALAETVHFSNLLEGNQLSEIEARRALRGELDRRGRAEIELVNYVEALDYIDTHVRSDSLRYDETTLLEVHGIITRGLGREDASFKPHHEGAWRDGVAYISDGRGGIDHTGTDATDVPDRIRGLLRYLERRTGDPEFPGPVLAAIAHHAITDVHPFADGNGRAARAFAFAVLRRERVLTRRLFSPDRHYALDKHAYIAALRSSKRPGSRTDTWTAPGSLNDWLLYYANSLASEFERMSSKVRELNIVADSTRPLQLTRSQEHMVAILSAGDLRDVSRTEYERLEAVSESVARTEISQLAKGGVLKAVGRGAATRYRLAAQQGGASTIWTTERIETTLREFLSNHGEWPTRAEFTNAGLNGLYQAMSRRGGVASWARRLGYTPPGKGPRRPT